METMDKRRDISNHSKHKLANGLMRGAVVSGMVSGLAAASLGGVPTASATCLGIFGISINDGSGGHCSSDLTTFSLGLGPGTSATAEGFFTAAIATGANTEASSDGLGTLAYAGGTRTLAETQGILNLAAAGLGFEGPLGVGTNVAAFAGRNPLDFVNIAVNIGSADDTFDSGGPAFSWVEASDGAFNLAGNLFGNANAANPDPTPMIVWSGGDDETLGFGTVAANVFGNRNDVQAIGSLLNATAWGNLFRDPNGSDNIVHAGTIGAPTSLSWAFSYQGIFSEPPEACTTGLCGNTVNATGPGAIAGAIGVVQRNVDQEGFGIKIATQGNDTGSTPVLAASATQRNLSRPSLNFTPGQSSTSNLRSTSPGGPIVKFTNQLAASAKKFNDQLAASSKKLTNQLAASAKKFNNQLAASSKKSNNQLAASIKKSSHKVDATSGAAKPDAASSTDGGSDK